MNDRKNKLENVELVLSVLSWASLVVVLLCVLLTTLHLNKIIDWALFKNYLFLEISIFIGLILWGLKFYFNSRRYTSYLKYSIYSFLFALIQLIFLLFTVY